jgi:hypothetical protein
VNTSHLLAIGFASKGVPTSMVLDPDSPEVDGVHESLVATHRPEIEYLLAS